MVTEHPVEGPQPSASLSASSEVLRLLAEGTSAATGDDFFRSLARHVATALGARYAFVAETLSAIPTPPAAFALALASVLRRFCTDAQCLEVSRELVRIFEVRK
jgi:hypothetical protein